MKVIKRVLAGTYFVVFSLVILVGMIHTGAKFAFALGKAIALELLKGV